MGTVGASPLNSIRMTGLELVLGDYGEGSRKWGLL